MSEGSPIDETHQRNRPHHLEVIPNYISTYTSPLVTSIIIVNTVNGVIDGQGRGRRSNREVSKA